MVNGLFLSSHFCLIEGGMMKKITIKTLVIYLSGLVILCVGTVLNTKTNLGVAAISGVSYVLSKTTSLTLGTATFLIFCIFIVMQWLINKKVDLLTVLQLPVSLLFGRLTNFVNTRVLVFEANNLVSGFIMLAFAIVLSALGVTLMVSQNLVPNAPDGAVQAIANKLGWTFGKAKVAFDLACISVSIVIALVMSGHIIGIGIGSLLSMLLIGNCCNVFKKVLGKEMALV